MNTLKMLDEKISIAKCFERNGYICSVHVEYRRHLYQFFSQNWEAYMRYEKKGYVNDKQIIFGYSLKQSYESFYKEFAKLHKEHSDKLTEIIR